MDFLLSEELVEFRNEVRQFITEHVTPELRARAHATGTNFDWTLQKELAKRGWLALEWPKKYGGAGASPWKTIILQEEFEVAAVPHFGGPTARALANIILNSGTETQKAEMIPRLFSADMFIVLGYTEPHCGSDVAAARTRAIKTDGGWLINGQKMFTTMAEVATHVILLTRTNTEVPKHRGLTTFIVPLDAPGINVQEVKTLGGERTNITYYSDVLVPDAQRVGEVDGGWDVMINALKTERPGGGRDLKDLLLLTAAELLAADENKPLQDPVIRERLAHIAIENEVARLLGFASVWHFMEGDSSGVLGSMFKTFSSESLLRSSSLLLDTLSPLALLAQGERQTLGNGLFEEAYRHAHVTTIYAGANEIQRSIIAERGLQLPRGR